MATKDREGEGFMNVSRRDFLKLSATAAAVGGALNFTFDPAKALAYENHPSEFKISTTTCPYCSASCGQRVVVDIRAGSPTEGQVIDIYGDFDSPFNQGGLCAKGSGAWQLVNNKRRIGAWAGTHPVNNIFAYDATYTDGIAYKRTGNGTWSKMDLQAALAEAALAMKNARDANGAFAAPAWNSKQVAFFGSSHINNEPNWVYRKLVANFGTSNTEHQARI
jgi:formate dehydrogenase major subunit